MSTDYNAEDNQVDDRCPIYKIGHLRPRRHENVWMYRDLCTSLELIPVARLAHRMAGRSCAMRCLLVGPKLLDARLATARVKSRCRPESHIKGVADTCILRGGHLARCWNGPVGTHEIMSFHRGVRHRAMQHVSSHPVENA